MKKLLIILGLSLTAFWSLGAMAEDIGVVNMQKIFKSSPKAKSINEDLKHQFASRRKNIVKMSKNLQDEVKKYQKNQSVLSKPKLAELQKKISDQSLALRQAQQKFQSDIATAQNKKMADFLKRVKTAVKEIATKKDLELVLPSSVVLYSENKMDITADVLAKMG